MAANPFLRGKLNEEDRLFRSAIPHCAEMERLVAGAVRRHAPSKLIEVLELGCGTGFSTASILRSRENISLTAVDGDARSIKQARINLRAWDVDIVRADMLAFLRRRRAASFDAVVTKFTLHNLERPYRLKVLREIRRVLKPGGLFVNADKFAQTGPRHAQAVRRQMARYLDLFLPKRRLDLLQEALEHTLHDEQPGRLMLERQALRDMRAAGFRGLRRLLRRDMDAVYRAVR